jgi:hypothetical protein
MHGHSVTGTFSWIRQPRNITAAMGFDVFMPCEYTGVRSSGPLWRRNGETFTRHDPPLLHSVNGSGLIISDVNLSMNMSWYSCFLDLFTGYYESTRGYITVLTQAGISWKAIHNILAN